MEEKRKRGRPRKVKPEEQKPIIEEPIVKEESVIKEEPLIKESSEWDFKIGDTIKYFDKDKSYELTG